MQPNRMVIEEMIAQSPRIGVAHMVDPSLHTGVQFSERNRVRLIEVDVALQPPPEVDGIAPLEQSVCWVDDETQPRNSMSRLCDLRFTFVDGQSQPRQAVHDLLFPSMKLFLVIAEQGKVVHVAQKRRTSQFTLNEPVKRVQIDVAPELACQVADRESAWAVGGEQVITGKIDHRVFILQHVPTAGEYLLDQPKQIGVMYDSADLAEKDDMVERRKVLDDIHTQYVTVSLGQALQTMDGGVCSFSRTIGVAVGMEAGIEDRFYQITQRVMDDAIPKGGGADFAALRFMNGEMMVCAGSVTSLPQFCLQPDELIGNLMLERGGGRMSSLAFGSFAGC